MTLVAMRRVDWKKAKMEAKRPVKRPPQLPRQQMKARTRDWSETELSVFKSY